MIKCNKCKKEKSHYAMSVCFDDNTENCEVVCIECLTGSKDMEDIYLRGQSAIFSEADKMWDRLLR